MVARVTAAENVRGEHAGAPGAALEAGLAALLGQRVRAAGARSRAQRRSPRSPNSAPDRGRALFRSRHFLRRSELPGEDLPPRQPRAISHHAHRAARNHRAGDRVRAGDQENGQRRCVVPRHVSSGARWRADRRARVAVRRLRVGAADRSTAPAPARAFSAPGTYSVTLTVVDANGLSSASTSAVTVPGPPAVARVLARHRPRALPRQGTANNT